MSWATSLLGCHSWRNSLRATRDWASAGRLGQDVAIGDEGGAFLLGSFAPFAQADVQRIAGGRSVGLAVSIGGLWRARAPPNCPRGLNGSTCSLNAVLLMMAST